MGTLPTAKTTYSIVNYSGNFNGPTNNVTFNGTPIVNPSNLTFTSSNANVVGRNTQLSVNNTTHTLDVIYQPGAIAGNLIWTGGTAHNSSVWDTNNTANWNNLANSSIILISFSFAMWWRLTIQPECRTRSTLTTRLRRKP